jgi:site-specific recombinase XerC
LREGASATTINIELSILRGFWRFMLRIDAPDVMINPGRGVRVKKESKKRRLINWPDGCRDEATESPA